jgi:hypothetical protein
MVRSERWSGARESSSHDVREALIQASMDHINRILKNQQKN